MNNIFHIRHNNEPFFSKVFYKYLIMIKIQIVLLNIVDHEKNLLKTCWKTGIWIVLSVNIPGKNQHAKKYEAITFGVGRLAIS